MGKVNICPSIHRLEDCVHYIGESKLCIITNHMTNIAQDGLNVDTWVPLKQIPHKVCQISERLSVISFLVKVAVRHL